MCHNWFKTDYFRLNLCLIIEIFVFVEEVNILLWETEIILNFVLPLIRIVYIFKSELLAHHCFANPNSILIIFTSQYGIKNNVADICWQIL